MAEVHVDVPGEVRWFRGYEPATILGPCTHECRHARTVSIAWGPDNEHYELVKCVDPRGCAGRCRGWAAEYDLREARHKGVPRLRYHGFKEVHGDA